MAEQRATRLAVKWMGLVRLASRAMRCLELYVPTTDPSFALTLDDGPDPALTPQVLDRLREHRVHATFFLIGSRAHTYPNLVRKIREEGHEIGNHMWRDERAARMSDAEFERSVQRTKEALAHAGAMRLLRPGSGFVGCRKADIAARLGYRCVLGSVYPLDAHVPSSRWMSWCVRTLLHPGAIVVLHEGQPSRERVLTVLDEVIRDAHRRGYSVVPVGTLMQVRTARREG
jgi:peptidoglycan-N-acetylglucosamine deacetylase